MDKQTCEACENTSDELGLSEAGTRILREASKRAFALGQGQKVAYARTANSAGEVHLPVHDFSGH